MKLFSLYVAELAKFIVSIADSLHIPPLPPASLVPNCLPHVFVLQMGATVQAVTVHFNSHWNGCTALCYTLLQFSWPFAPHLVNLLPIYISLINAIAPSTSGKAS